MVAFLLQIRLLMLSWTARCSDEKKRALWVTEKRGFCVFSGVHSWGCNRLLRELEEESSWHRKTFFELQRADHFGGFKSLCWFDP
ncbi:hypothetical protein CRYUN_Cryun39dG0063400 [Craigia yunnanensis]